jgi:hypothetical protein
MIDAYFSSRRFSMISRTKMNLLCAAAALLHAQGNVLGQSARYQPAVFAGASLTIPLGGELGGSQALPDFRLGIGITRSVPRLADPAPQFYSARPIQKFTYIYDAGINSNGRLFAHVSGQDVGHLTNQLNADGDGLSTGSTILIGLGVVLVAGTVASVVALDGAFDCLFLTEEQCREQKNK